MKILQICAYAGPYEGNFMKSLYALEKRMLNYGYETIYAFPESIKDNEWVKKLVAKKERKKESILSSIEQSPYQTKNLY